MKERIIGAAVLVLFVVLVVPVFLDGPPDDDEIVSESVLLPGQEAQKTQTVVLERDREEPVPNNVVLAEESPQPAPQKQAPARQSAPKVTPPPEEESVEEQPQPVVQAVSLTKE